MSFNNNDALRDLIIMEPNEELEKRIILDRLPKKIIVQLALKHKFISSKNNFDGAYSALLRLPMSQFKKILKPFIMAGTVTGYLFVLDNVLYENIRKDYRSVSERFKSFLNKRYFNFILTFYEVDDENKEIFGTFRVFTGKTKVRRIEYKSRDVYIKYNPVDDYHFTIYVDDGILFVRGKDKTLAKDLAKHIMSILGSAVDPRVLQISSKDELKHFLKWVTTVRHADFRLEGDISSLSMTSRGDSKRRIYKDLKNIDAFWDYFKKGLLVGVYIHLPLNKGSEIEADYIGFSYNFIQGKIHFKTAVTENIIRDILKGILSQINIRRDDNVQQTLFNEFK